MTYVNDISYNVITIRRRAIAFWTTAVGAAVSALALFLLDYTGMAKVVLLAGTILSVATWMSAMMSLCPGCRAYFHEGYAPRLWPKFGCAHCNLGLHSDTRPHTSADSVDSAHRSHAP